MLARFTQIDYDREIAMVAIQENEGQEKLLGVARIIGDPDGKFGEFAVAVGDPWHGQGIGAVLLQKCLDIAKTRGFETIMGCVLRENKGMLSLGKKLGFKVEKHSDIGECELTCNLLP
jgi:acetyltransferase